MPSGKRTSSKSEQPESSSPPDFTSLLLVEEKTATKIGDGLQRIADVLEQWVKLEQQRFDIEHPQRTPNPVTVGVAKYPDAEKAQPEQPLPGEDLTEGLGPREKKLVEARFAKSKVRGASQARN